MQNKVRSFQKWVLPVLILLLIVSLAVQRAQNGTPQSTSAAGSSASAGEALAPAASAAQPQSAAADTAPGAAAGSDSSPAAPDSAAQSGQSAAAASGAAQLREDGSYTAPADVALYLVTYGHLPGNYISKSKAQDLGWDSASGNLQQVAPGKSIGGGRFGNYEGLLPDGTWYECDVNYDGGFRGAERLIYSRDGQTGYYTNDHYKTFTQLY